MASTTWDQYYVPNAFLYISRQLSCRELCTHLKLSFCLITRRLGMLLYTMPNHSPHCITEQRYLWPEKGWVSTQYVCACWYWWHVCKMILYHQIWSPLWKLQRYPCACRFYSWRYKVPTSFLAPLPGNGSYIIFGLSHPRILFFFFDSTSMPIIHGAAIPSTTLFTQQQVLWASIFRWPNSFNQLWTQLRLYSLS